MSDVPTPRSGEEEPAAGAPPVVAVVGTGSLGSALAGGLVAAGHPAEALLLTDADADAAQRVARSSGGSVVALAEAGERADVVAVVVKPPVVPRVLGQLAPSLSPGAVVASLAAGVGLAALEAPLPDGTPVVRVMTNTPLLVGRAMSAVSGGTAAGDDDVARVVTLLRAVGDVVVLPEDDLHAVTALSGSGPAVVSLVVEALVDAGVAAGLARATAQRLVVQTVAGTAALLLETDASTFSVRAGVTSPGGTTAAALAAAEDRGLRAALAAGVVAAARRSQELAG